MEQEKVDVVAEVARKFAAGEVPQEAARSKATTAKPMFTYYAEDCSFWCIFTRCRAEEPTQKDRQA